MTDMEKGTGSQQPPIGQRQLEAAPGMTPLNAWAGEWTTVERHYPAPWAPQGGGGKGISSIRIGPGGILVEDYRSVESPMGEFAGLAIITTGVTPGSYRLHWFDSVDPEGWDARGTLKGDFIEFLGEGKTGDGKAIVFRMLYRDIKPDSRVLTCEQSVDGAPMTDVFAIEYRRATTH